MNSNVFTIHHSQWSLIFFDNLDKVDHIGGLNDVISDYKYRRLYMTKYYYQDGILGQFCENKCEKHEIIKKHYGLMLRYEWIEEKFKIVLDNYTEFEQTIYEVYHDCKACQKNDKELVERAQKGINTVNRRVANLLTTVRMYYDHLFHDVSTHEKVLGLSKGLYSKPLSKKANELYDRCVSYQIMEFSRNIIQHKALFIKEFQLVFPFEENDSDILPMFANVDVKDLMKDSGFENKIKDKESINYSDGKLNYIYHVRNYIDAIIEFHKEFQQLSKQYWEKSQKILDNELKEIGVNSQEVAFWGIDKNGTEVDGVLVDIRKLIRVEVLAKVDKSKYFMIKRTFPNKSHVKIGSAFTPTFVKNLVV